MSTDPVNTEASVETKPDIANGAGHVEASGSKVEDKTGTTAVEEKPVVEEKPEVEQDLSTPKLEGKSDEEVEELLARAAKQSRSQVHSPCVNSILIFHLPVNFYFSDANLPIDKFFFSLTVCNPAGWVPLETILTFKRMREFQEHGQEIVVTALRRQIRDEGRDPLLAVSEDGKNVRRKRPMEPSSTSWSRQVYVVSN